MNNNKLKSRMKVNCLGQEKTQYKVKNKVMMHSMLKIKYKNHYNKAKPNNNLALRKKFNKMTQIISSSLQQETVTIPILMESIEIR